MTARKEIPCGTRFGKWTVLRAVPGGTSSALYLCVCECGLQRSIASIALRQGRSKACRKCADYPGPKPTHGYSLSPTHRSWGSMKSRCLNPAHHAYPDYGGRGITVCERWRDSFENFLADMGERPPETSLDRYPDKDGNYEPHNCRWATRKEQQRNRRINHHVTAFGTTRTVAEWAELTGLSHATISKRLRKGLTPEDAINL